MSDVFLLIGGIFGGLCVIFGAFGAHALKKWFSPDLLTSFETGVKYQMYHALVLILCGILFSFEKLSQQMMGWSFVAGIILFSFSIYGLTISSSMDKKLGFLGPITPLGGLLLLLGWILFVYNIFTAN